MPRWSATHFCPPILLVVSGLVLTRQAVLVLATGSVLLFLLQFPLASRCVGSLGGGMQNTHVWAHARQTV